MRAAVIRMLCCVSSIGPLGGLLPAWHTCMCRSQAETRLYGGVGSPMRLVAAPAAPTCRGISCWAWLCCVEQGLGFAVLQHTHVCMVCAPQLWGYGTRDAVWRLGQPWANLGQNRSWPCQAYLHADAAQIPRQSVVGRTMIC